MMRISGLKIIIYEVFFVHESTDKWIKLGLFLNIVGEMYILSLRAESLKELNVVKNECRFSLWKILFNSVQEFINEVGSRNCCVCVFKNQVKNKSFEEFLPDFSLNLLKKSISFFFRNWGESVLYAGVIWSHWHFMIPVF